ncbi:WD40/YVTN/BNR-like repeat-containing protein [Flavobacterium sp.]|uniref:WD40/YVTN/BNR-like repeat-containing protein n=1 Tax=Flavobacterium sp. TaxID=239 RepID=UPI002FD97584
MKTKLLFSSFLLLSLVDACCGQKNSVNFNNVVIGVLLNDKISIRAIEIDADDADKLWYAGDKNRFGFYDFKEHEKTQKEIHIDSLKMEFRSMAQTKDYLFLANIGNPAYIFKVKKSDLSWEKVYEENHEKVFYDSMKFWNEQEGIAIGDPTESCLSILITRDGGNSWKKLSCESLPKIIDGEAAFAASNTNIVIKGNKTWIVSGGVKSRVFSSEDKGNSWKVIETPIVQGKAMTGIFTADFYDENIGIIAGGNYEIPIQNFQNKAMTQDGGKTWKLIAENAGFGYASCVQFVPKSNGKQIVSVGASGLYYSADGGNS